MSRVSMLATALLAMFVPWVSHAASAMSVPFSPTSPRAGSSDITCPSAGTPVIELTVTSRYGSDGPQRDTEDAAAEAEQDAQMAPVRAYARNVVAAANRYTRRGHLADADCALALLHAWAGANALTHPTNANAEFERGSTLAALGLAWLQIAPAVKDDPRASVVLSWMHGLASASAQYFDSTSGLRGSRNNHLYWATLGTASVAVATGDQALLDGTARVYRDAVCGATPEGALPLEVGRGKKALSYHLFALDALVPLAAILQANHVDAIHACDGALQRVVNFSLTSIHDPSTMAKLAGKPQEAFPGGAPNNGRLAFIELYHRWFPGRAPGESDLLARRPFVSTNMGGDQTLLYSR
ncbi:poly(beta-D-mannuronate) lyase [Luteibacter sp. Sphag1AF]|uniref:alginate lyase family protein n=1 Tax=Luteibacter sp. Sphag1AF TaxID=2587031 RepID=UPI0016194C2B|nr:alginate lyase family protein [Luteibacter sp. Sphag1AF]MBB3226599.1 poly(beta-D-mannuronate) lyase [Luteibacter sp. Sphag1AF]